MDSKKTTVKNNDNKYINVLDKDDVDKTNGSNDVIMKNKSKLKKTIWTQWSILINIICLVLIWFGNYTAYLTLEVLQSSINHEIGIYSITLSHVCKLLTSFFGPIIVYKLTPKWTVFLMTVSILIFVISNFYPKSYILIPAGILVGLTQGPGWISFGIYGTVMGVKYADITRKPKDRVLSRFNGFMTAAIPSAIAVGSFLSSFILKNIRFKNENVYDAHNTTHLNNYTYIQVDPNVTTVGERLKFKDCGPHYCPDTNNIYQENNTTANLTPEEVIPDIRVFYILLVVLGLFVVLSLLLSIFGLKNLEPDEYILKQDKKRKKKKANYLKKFFDWRFFLLVPSFSFIFLYMSYMVSLFPRAYITCLIGVEMIGYMAMARGISDFLTSIFMGLFGHCCSKNVWLGISALLGAVNTVILLFLWDLLTEEKVITIILVLVSLFSGITNSMNISQFSAFLGSAFTDKKTEAFSFFHFVGSAASAIGFYSNVYLCVNIQLYILLVNIILAVVTFGIMLMYLKKHSAMESDIKDLHELEVKLSEEKGMIN